MLYRENHNQPRFRSPVAPPRRDPNRPMFPDDQPSRQPVILPDNVEPRGPEYDPEEDPFVGPNGPEEDPKIDPFKKTKTRQG